MSRFLQTAKEQVEFYELSLSQIAEDEQPAAIRSFGQTLERLLGAVGQISTSDGGEFLRLIRPAKLADDTRRSIVQTVMARVAEGQTGFEQRSQRGGSHDMQHCSSFYYYVPDELWAVLADTSSQYEVVLGTVARLCERLGMMYLNETSYTHLASCLYMGARFVNVDALGPADRQFHWKIKEDLKLAIRSLRGRNRRLHWGKVSKYPATPAELKEQHPEIWNFAYGEPHGWKPPQASRAHLGPHWLTPNPNAREEFASGYGPRALLGAVSVTGSASWGPKCNGPFRGRPSARTPRWSRRSRAGSRPV